MRSVGKRLLLGHAAPVLPPIDAGSALGATWQLCVGVKPLTKRWANGKLFDITISGSAVTLSAVGMKHDIARLAMLLGVDPINGIGGAPISKWYDQSGLGNDVTQATVTNQMWIALIYGEVYVVGDGWFADNLANAAGTKTRFFNLPSGMMINKQSLTAFAVLTHASSTNIFYTSQLTNTTTVLLAPGAAADNATTFEWGTDHYCLDFNGFVFQYAATPLGVPAQKTLFSFTSAASGITFGTNDKSTSAGAISAGTSTGGNLFGGVADLPSGFWGNAQAFMLSANVLTAAQQTAIRQSIYYHFGIRSAPQINFVNDGASVDYGTGAYLNNVQDGSVPAAARGWEQFMLDDLTRSGYDVRLYSSGFYGSTIAQLAARWDNDSANFDPGLLYDPTASMNVLFAAGLSSHNSFHGGSTDAMAWADMQIYLTNCKANGRNWDAIITFGNYGDNSNGGIDYGTPFTNTMVTNASSLGFTCVANPFANFPASDPTGIYENISGPSQGHPTIIGYKAEADIITPIVKSILAASGKAVPNFPLVAA